MDLQLFITIICSVFASTGFWAFITFLVQRRDKKETAESKMLKGLAYDRICTLGAHYIKQGYISKEDFENLHDYLYIPYRDLGGNGTVSRIMNEVLKLPLKEGHDVE